MRLSNTGFVVFVFALINLHRIFHQEMRTAEAQAIENQRISTNSPTNISVLPIMDCAQKINPLMQQWNRILIKRLVKSTLFHRM